MNKTAGILVLSLIAILLVTQLGIFDQGRSPDEVREDIFNRLNYGVSTWCIEEKIFNPRNCEAAERARQ